MDKRCNITFPVGTLVYCNGLGMVINNDIDDMFDLQYSVYYFDTGTTFRYGQPMVESIVKTYLDLFG